MKVIHVVLLKVVQVVRSAAVWVMVYLETSGVSGRWAVANEHFYPSLHRSRPFRGGAAQAIQSAITQVSICDRRPFPRNPLWIVIGAIRMFGLGARPSLSLF